MAVDFDSLALAPCIAAFGQAVTYQPYTGAAFALTAIFNEFAEYEQIDASTEVMTTRRRPILSCRFADFPSGLCPTEQDGVIINGVQWVVAAPPVPDGLGEMTLYLKRAAA